MSILVAWVVFPLVLLALCVGLGLLVGALSGRRVKGTLLAPLGFATMIVLGQFTTITDTTAELTLPLILFLAILGVGFSLPWHYGSVDRWAIAVAFAVFALFAAPTVLSGAPTFAGFIMLDDTATWLALTDRVMEHGRGSLDDLGFSSYRATLDFNLAGGYPIGVFIPFGIGQKLVGGDLAWVFQPYLSVLAALLSLSLWEVLRGVVAEVRLRALAVFVAAQPALLFGYALWGGIKELGAAALIALAAALAPAAAGAAAGWRDAALLALPAGALVGVLSLGGLVWLAPMLLVVAIAAWLRLGSRPTATQALAFVVPLVVFVFPVVNSGLVPPTSSPLTDPNAEGNLRGPLNLLQALGVWPAGDFRIDPDGTVVTAVLIALAALAFGLGLWAAWRSRRRDLTLALYATVLVAGLAIVVVGSPWAGAKALATASPVALSLALVGAVYALRLERLAGILLIVAVGGGVLWSNVLAYGGVSLAPYDQLVELEEIGTDLAGEGPALMTEYNPYGARHFLRQLDGEGASELRERLVPQIDGTTVEKGYAVDTDELDPAGLLEYRTLVLRRSPVRSRPPSPYRRVWSGDYYEVWQRPGGDSEESLRRLPLGGPLEPAAVPACAEVLALADEAAEEPDARLLAAQHPPIYDATAGPFRVASPGPYTAWLLGSARGEVGLEVDGEEIGSVRHELNNEGGFLNLGTVELTPGAHRAKLSIGGADLHPGSGGFPRPRLGPLLFVPAEEEDELRSVPAAEAQRLCGRPWDWIELTTP